MMRAIRTEEGHKAAVVDHPIPELRPTYMLLKVYAVGINPIDYKLIDVVGPADRTVGCEVAGEVVEIGSDVTAPFKKGDRVTAITHGVHSDEIDNGCFAEYAVVKGDIAIKIPDWLGWEEASVLPMGAITAGMGLYQQLGLAWPDALPNRKTSILIYGASSGMGLYAVKMATLYVNSLLLQWVGLPSDTMANSTKLRAWD